MKFTDGTLHGRLSSGEEVLMTAFEKVDVTLAGAGRLKVKGVEKGGTRAMDAEMVVRPGGVTIGEKLRVEIDRAQPPDGGRPLKNIVLHLWNEAAA